MALLKISIDRSETVEAKTARVTIAVKSTGQVLDSYSTNFPPDTGDGHILENLLQKGQEMMRNLAIKQIPASFSFEIDSDQVRLRRLFDL